MRRCIEQKAVLSIIGKRASSSDSMYVRNILNELCDEIASNCVEETARWEHLVVDNGLEGYKCTGCGHKTEKMTKYCDTCGARMEKTEDSRCL